MGGETTDYDVSIVWNDYQNNDGARPQSIHIGLVDSRYNNSVIQEATVTGDKHNERWSYTFTVCLFRIRFQFAEANLWDSLSGHILIFEGPIER